MADWRQIQARIRKAKNSPEAQTKLADLFARTRDAMVAWELALIEEKAGRNEEAGKWYGLAAQRFRRSDWKKKAEEALTRLGFPVPVAAAELPHEPEPVDATHESEGGSSTESHLNEGAEAADTFNTARPESASSPTTEPVRRGRRRGRRGGRGRRGRGGHGAPGLPTQAFAQPSQSSESHPPAQPFEQPRTENKPPMEASRSSRADPSGQTAHAPSEPMLPSERTAHGRAGDPALASRLAQLESKLRRLLSSPLHRLDQVEEAPAGPGVFLLSDSDQIHTYYIEACQTLRVGITNLVRGGHGRGKPGRGGRGGSERDLRGKLAEHLEINEAKVTQYLKDHCVVRWIQLDEDAPHLAHFAIAVLHTPLNVD